VRESGTLVEEHGFRKPEAVRSRAGGVGRSVRRPRMSVVQEAGKSGIID
jgi:hypothetical protein